jgi:hypothetical protein
MRQREDGEDSSGRHPAYRRSGSSHDGTPVTLTDNLAGSVSLKEELHKLQLIAEITRGDENWWQSVPFSYPWSQTRHGCE